MADQQFCLRWNNHQSTLISVFDSLLERGAMVDCTLAAEGQCLQAHKVVLSACSPYLETLLSQHYDKHPILLLKDVKFYELQAMMDYMYRGEVNVAQDKLGMFLKAAESLQIKGLSDSGGNEPPDTGGGTSAKRTSKGAPVTNVPRSGGGLTVERRRPQQPQTSQVVDIPSDSGSRDGSESPSLRRKRRRRTSGGDDSAVEGDSSNTGDVSRTQSSAPLSSDQVPMNGSADSNALGILSSLMDGSVETDNSVQEPGPSLGATSQTQPSQRIREKMEPTSAEMIQPKAEYLESEENVEDLTLDDDDTGMDAGPSQRQGSGYQWHMGDQSADEVFMAAQEAVGANRDAQDPLSSPGLQQQQQQHQHQCDSCGRQYQWRESLLRHRRVECGKTASLQCPVCPTRTKHKHSLQRHLMLHYASDGPDHDPLRHLAPSRVAPRRRATRRSRGPRRVRPRVPGLRQVVPVEGFATPAPARGVRQGAAALLSLLPVPLQAPLPPQRAHERLVPQARRRAAGGTA
ncbi:longitudinals lacking protein isoform X8 [Frankliniella occidentalis]|uniref:Longitudinals lacking protein isoform X8 n=1 Tax=Frankliniella occidentalis TaxID=133901 RepID=A0A9C6WX81_FRAOC|nr:longitudinals lacking protein isoform X8 [Frankliniella occidentalis]